MKKHIKEFLFWLVFFFVLWLLLQGKEEPQPKQKTEQTYFIKGEPFRAVEPY